MRSGNGTTDLCSKMKEFGRRVTRVSLFKVGASREWVYFQKALKVSTNDSFCATCTIRSNRLDCFPTKCQSQKGALCEVRRAPSASEAAYQSYYKVRGDASNSRPLQSANSVSSKSQIKKSEVSDPIRNSYVIQKYM